MSEIKITEAIEDTIKLQYAQEYSVAGSKTWESSEFLKFRQAQLNKLNKDFTDFLNKPENGGERFYEMQFQNDVFQDNINRKFRKQVGINPSLFKQITNKINLHGKEAEGEWYEGLGGGFSNPKDKNFIQRAISKGVDSVFKTVYSFSHMVEQVGARMTQYALSDNKKDLKNNPLKFVAKKLFILPYGAVIRAGGTVMKTITNPLYPVQNIKRVFDNANGKNEKTNLLDKSLSNSRTIENVRNVVRSVEEISKDYNDNAKRLKDFKQRVAEIQKGGQVIEKVGMKNKYSSLDNGQFAVALGTAYENLAYINAYSMKEDDKKAVLDEIKLVMEEAKRRYPNVGQIPNKGKYFEDKEVAEIEAQMMPYMRAAAKDNRVLAQDVQKYESWRDGKEAEIVRGGIRVTEMPFENKARYCISEDKNFTVSKDMVKNPYEAGKNTMSRQEFLQQKALVDKLTIR